MILKPVKHVMFVGAKEAKPLPVKPITLEVALERIQMLEAKIKSLETAVTRVVITDK